MRTIEKTDAVVNMYNINRRDIILSSLMLSSVGLSGCASLPGFSFTDAIRRMMTLSSQRAFVQLLQPGGFYDDQLTRIALPQQLGGNRGANVLSALLSTKKVRTQLQQQMNRVAEKGAERAAPFIAESIKTVGIEGAQQIIRGGPTAATDFLRGNIGNSLVTAMVPGISDGLKLFDNDIISRAVGSVSGFDIAQLGQDIVGKASNSIWSAMGREESVIRANPRATNDPLLIGVFGLAG